MSQDYSDSISFESDENESQSQDEGGIKSAENLEGEHTIDKNPEFQQKYFFEDDAEESGNKEGSRQKIISQEREEIRKNHDCIGQVIDLTRKKKSLQEVVKEIQNDDLEIRYREQMRKVRDEAALLHQQKNQVKNDACRNEFQKLFKVPIRKFKDQEAAICLLNKFASVDEGKRFSNIYSISFFPSEESFIFIESKSRRDVQDFLNNYFYANCNQIELVSREHTDNLINQKENASTNPLTKGRFVKISQNSSNSIYKCDMGQIFELKKLNKVVVKLIPRIDISQLISKAKQKRKNISNSFFQDNIQKNNKVVETYQKNSTRQNLIQTNNNIMFEQMALNRPKQLFISSDYEGVFKKNKAYKLVTEYFHPENGHCGYVYLTFSSKDLEINYKPSLNELINFFPQENENEIKIKFKSFMKCEDNSPEFQKRDSVSFMDKQNVIQIGIIISLTPQTALVKIRSANSQSNSLEKEISLKCLAKYFENGQRVQVTRGQYEGIVGDVIGIEGDQCNLFTVNNRIISIRKGDIRSANLVEQQVKNEIEIQSISRRNPQEKFLRQIKHKDLIRISGFRNNVGMVLEVKNNDTLTVLLMNGQIEMISAHSIEYSIDTKKYQLNLEGKIIMSGTNVQIKHGQYQNVKCEVIHVYQQFIILFSPIFQREFLVEIVNNVKFLSQGQKYIKYLQHSRSTKQINEQAHLNQQYIGNQMKIMKGPFKGFQATIKEIRGEFVKVEVHSKFSFHLIHLSEIIPFIGIKEDSFQDLQRGQYNIQQQYD